MVATLDHHVYIEDFDNRTIFAGVRVEHPGGGWASGLGASVEHLALRFLDQRLESGTVRDPSSGDRLWVILGTPHIQVGA